MTTPTPRKRWPLIAAAGAVVALLVGGGLVWHSRSSGPRTRPSSPAAVPTSTPRLAWDRRPKDVEDLWGNVAVTEDQVVLIDGETLVAVEASSGSPRWTTRVGPMNVIKTPGVGDPGVLVFATGDRGAGKPEYAAMYDAITGRRRWVVDGGDNEFVPTWSRDYVSIYGVDDGAAAQDDTVTVVVDRATGKTMWSAENVTLCSDDAAVALTSYDEGRERGDYDVRDPATGKVRWSEHDAVAWGCVPAGLVLGGQAEGTVDARDQLTGDVLLSTDAAASSYIVRLGDRYLTVGPEKSVFGLNGEHIATIDQPGRVLWDAGGATPTNLVWVEPDDESAPPGSLTVLDLERAKAAATIELPQWSRNRSSAGDPYPAVGRDAVVVATDATTVTAYDRDDLAKRWSFDVSADDPEANIDEIHLADGVVIVVMSDGQVLAYT